MALFDELGDMLTGGSNLGALSSFLDTDDDKASGLLGMAGPALLGALGKRAGAPGGADAIFGLANSADDGILDNLGGFLGGGDVGGIGGQLLGGLLGSRQSAVESGLASQSGLGGGIVQKLLPMLAPMVMSFLKRKMMGGGGMNAGGLASMLGDNTNAMRQGGLGSILDLLDGDDDEADNAGFLERVKAMGPAVGATSAVGAVAASGADDEGLLDKAGDMVGGIGDAAGDMADKAKDMVSGGVDDVRDAIGSASGGGSNLMKMLLPLIGLAIALALIFWACSGGDDDAAVGTGDCDTVDDVSLQLQWFAQSQFAGYYAAADEGIYSDYCLDVTILEGGVDIVPAQQLASGAADYAISWVPRALVSRSEGLDIVNVAQVFQRSGTLQVSFADAGIDGPEDLAGASIGSWGFGNEFELFAGMRSVGLDPGSEEIVQQNFDMLALINGEIDAAQAMIYNEYAQVLETINPATGELFQPDDLTVIDWNDVGTAMLQDAIWADGSRLGDADYQDITTRFIAASLEGWAWCRDNADDCVEVVLNNGPTLGTSHQTWQLNEINQLIWPSPAGAGVVNPVLWDQTIEVATSEGVLAAAPDADAFTTTYANNALEILINKGIDTNGDDFSPVTVTLNEGGS